jgi:hypothetical protein
LTRPWHNFGIAGDTGVARIESTRRLLGGLCDNTEHHSFAVNKSTDALHFLGSTSQNFLYDTPLSFSGNNVYAYGTQCIDFEANFLDTFHVYQRGTNGFLTLTGINAPTPLSCLPETSTAVPLPPQTHRTTSPSPSRQSLSRLPKVGIYSSAEPLYIASAIANLVDRAGTSGH